MEKQAELVFIPSPSIGHLVSTLQIAKLLSSRNTHLSITVLIIQFPAASDVPTTHLDSHRMNRIKFIYLPQPKTDTTVTSAGNRMLGFVETQKPYVKAAVENLMKTNATRIAGFVVDMFCTAMIDVADELNIPSYIFFTSSAATLGLLFHFQKQNDQRSVDFSEFKDSDAELVIPGFTKPLPAKVLPGRLIRKESADSFLNVAKKFRQTKGIMVNSFSALESHALHALADAHVDILPPVYPVGPLLNLKSDDVDDSKAMQKDDVMKWLDDQPLMSVVFLCFGSMGSFKETQVQEIAKALEHSGKRFLWSLRQPPPATGSFAHPGEYDDVTLASVLPEGFLERMDKIGKVIGWAPQVEVLGHQSVGGFVSHCGWNSTLEATWHGVSVATWPMYAEQQLNAFEIVEELGIGVEVDMSYRSDANVLVRAEDIERGIREVMDVESDVRKRVKEMSEKGKRALMEGGSSYVSLGCFIDQI